MGKGQFALSEEMMKFIAETAATTAIEQYKKEQAVKVKQEQDRRLHNVKLLLKNYRKFKAAAEKAEGKITSLDRSTLDYANDLGEMIVPSIREAKARTVAMVRYLDRTLEYYKDLCEQEGELGQRKYETVYFMYIADENMSAVKIGQRHQLVESAVYKNAAKAYEDLGGMMFGVDYLKLAE